MSDEHLRRIDIAAMRKISGKLHSDAIRKYFLRIDPDELKRAYNCYVKCPDLADERGLPYVFLLGDEGGEK